MCTRRHHSMCQPSQPCHYPPTSAACLPCAPRHRYCGVPSIAAPLSPRLDRRDSAGTGPAQLAGRAEPLARCHRRNRRSAARRRCSTPDPAPVFERPMRSRVRTSSAVLPHAAACGRSGRAMLAAACGRVLCHAGGYCCSAHLAAPCGLAACQPVRVARTPQGPLT